MRYTRNVTDDTVGAKRIVEFFAWFPVSVKTYGCDNIVRKETRWLEKVRVSQIFRRITWTNYGWENEEFL